jgi:acetyl-CoA carboxylase biotin carboxylase subunit
VRDDSGAYQGYTVPRFYDTLLAKLIVWGPDRAAAVDRMARALAEYKVIGVRTTIPVLERIIAHPDFRAGRLSTAFLERMEAELPANDSRHATIATIAAVLTEYERGRQPASAPWEGAADSSMWRRATPPGWRGR